MSATPPGNKAPTLSHQTILDLLRTRAGLIFPDTRLGEIHRAIEKAAVNAQFSLPQYAQNLTIDDACFDDLCNEVTISESYFFRDPKQFEFVKHRVIPEYLAQGLQHGPLQAWSAGCSTGEEAYSLAILFDQEGLSSSFRLTASDICKKSLAAAAQAHYNPWSLRTADQSFCQAHFDQIESKYRLKDRYKESVKFAHLNLVGDQSHFKHHHLANLDLIFCRNVLIYFDTAAIQKAIQVFHNLLKPGGYLVLGPSDPAASQYANFDVIVCDYGVFYKKVEKNPVTEMLTSAARLLTGHPLSSPPPWPGHGHKDGDKDNDKNYPSRHSKEDEGKNRQQHNKTAAPAASARSASSTNLSSVSPPKTDAEILEMAQSAYDQGQYEKASILTAGSLDNEKIAILHIKAQANFKGTETAEKILSKLILKHTNSFHLQYLHGHLRLDLGQLDLALTALKRCLFLDSRVAMAHFTMALVQKRLSDRIGAQRSFRNVIELCKDRPPDELLPFGDGERVKILFIAATTELGALSAPEGREQ
ncbi:MAG: protein-glutamate O-methyltransferase CheR [Cyanobacteria bacterium REEB67]|nr:protein-glutamate O-methyltransferase CheR [Cyanobacteria bacterium REEB67]